MALLPGHPRTLAVPDPRKVGKTKRSTSRNTKRNTSISSNREFFFARRALSQPGLQEQVEQLDDELQKRMRLEWMRQHLEALDSSGGGHVFFLYFWYRIADDISCLLVQRHARHEFRR